LEGLELIFFENILMLRVSGRTMSNDLTIKINKYNKEEKIKWEFFKVTMNQNVNDIGVDVKEMKTNNKK